MKGMKYICFTMPKSFDIEQLAKWSVNHAPIFVIGERRWAIEKTFWPVLFKDFVNKMYALGSFEDGERELGEVL